MAADSDTSPSSLLTRLAERLGGPWSTIFSTDWPGIIQRMGGLAQLLTPKRASVGLYEILDYDLTLDIKDKEGRLAVFHRRQKVRFLQDHVIAYQDEAWGDGEVVAGYKCKPGEPVDFFQVGSRHLILISLRQPKNRGDVVNFEIEREVKDGFTKAQEWLEVETRYPTKRLRIAIRFPRGRHATRAWLVMRRADRTFIFSPRRFSYSRSGQQSLKWTNSQPILSESYTICWAW